MISLKLNLCVQLFLEKVLILLKYKRFLMIGGRWRTTANGGLPLRAVAKARERLSAVRFLGLRMARIVYRKVDDFC